MHLATLPPLMAWKFHFAKIDLPRRESVDCQMSRADDFWPPKSTETNALEVFKIGPFRDTAPKMAIKNGTN